MDSNANEQAKTAEDTLEGFKQQVNDVLLSAFTKFASTVDQTTALAYLNDTLRTIQSSLESPTRQPGPFGICPESDGAASTSNADKKHEQKGGPLKKSSEGNVSALQSGVHIHVHSSCKTKPVSVCSSNLAGTDRVNLESEAVQALTELKQSRKNVRERQAVARAGIAVQANYTNEGDTEENKEEESSSLSSITQMRKRGSLIGSNKKSKLQRTSSSQSYEVCVDEELMKEQEEPMTLKSQKVAAKHEEILLREKQLPIVLPPKKNRRGRRKGFRLPKCTTPMVCPECKDPFFHKKSLTAHIRKHGFFPCSCVSCRLEFYNFADFCRHACRTVKSGPFTCLKCNTVFMHSQHYEKHLAGHSKNDCKICGKLFTKRKELCKHMRNVHSVAEPEKLYTCKYCDRSFMKRPSLYAHLREHAEDGHVCQKCGEICDNKETLESHLQKHIDEAPYNCSKCNETFMRRQQYDQHIAGHRKYDCPVESCTENFSTKKGLQKHLCHHHGINRSEEKKHRCEICSKAFQRPTLLNIHLRLHTGEKPIQCTMCDKSFRSYKALEKHALTLAHLKQTGQPDDCIVDADRPFLCATCGASFHHKQGLVRHMKGHNEERPFECPYCEYKCKCSTNLKRHIELHTDKRRFVCELCGSAFHAHATLKEHHAYVHSEDRRFPCPKCDKNFKGRSGLQRHMRIHSDERPYICHCGQSYKRMSHLKRHMQALHGHQFPRSRTRKSKDEIDQTPTEVRDVRANTSIDDIKDNYGITIKKGNDVSGIKIQSAEQTLVKPEYGAVQTYDSKLLEIFQVPASLAHSLTIAGQTVQLIENKHLSNDELTEQEVHLPSQMQSLIQHHVSNSGDISHADDLSSVTEQQSTMSPDPHTMMQHVLHIPTHAPVQHIMSPAHTSQQPTPSSTPHDQLTTINQNLAAPSMVETGTQQRIQHIQPSVQDFYTMNQTLVQYAGYNNFTYNPSYYEAILQQPQMESALSTLES